MTGEEAAVPPIVRRIWGLAEGLPIVGDLAAIPRRAGEATVDGIRATIDLVVDEVMSALSRADLTAVITESLDLNQLLDTIDLDALLARLDLNALLAQIDLNPLLERIDLNEVIERIDMNPIVRGATTSVTGDVLDDVRTNSVRADDRVEQFVSRILGRQTDG